MTTNNESSNVYTFDEPFTVSSKCPKCGSTQRQNILRNSLRYLWEKNEGIPQNAFGVVNVSLKSGNKHEAQKGFFDPIQNGI
jgi:hypothetical protein